MLRNSARDSKKGDKLKPRWLGPYKVHKCLEKGLYRISNLKTGTVLKNVVNQCRLTMYSGSPPKGSTLPPPPGDSSDPAPGDSTAPHSDFAPGDSSTPLPHSGDSTASPTPPSPSDSATAPPPIKSEGKAIGDSTAAALPPSQPLSLQQTALLPPGQP